jgi:hypothetical protein
MGGIEKGMAELPAHLKMIERFPGHVPKMGKSAGEELNWAYCVMDTETNEECIAMFCKPNSFTLIDKETWNTLQKEETRNQTWYLAPVGYITRTVKEGDTFPFTYLHQFILGHYGQGKGKQSVDHTNQNKLDNRSSNLRIVCQGEQNKNRGKVSRHQSAKELPKEITEPLPKFCVYYKECYNKEKDLWREFFTIEGHPKQEGKRKATTKSAKVTILDKLKEAKEILAELDGVEKKETKINEVCCDLCDQLFLDEDDRKLKQEGTKTSYYCSTCMEMRGTTKLDYFLNHIKQIYENHADLLK